MRASGACLTGLERLMSEHAFTLEEADGFVADIGPGSFTGVRVGVTLAKVLAWSHSKQAAGLSSFDLIDSVNAVFVPSKKAEWFVRIAGEEPFRTERPLELGTTGYGSGIVDPTYPSASGFASRLDALEWVSPEQLVPLYLIEPSISQPKAAYAMEPKIG